MKEKRKHERHQSTGLFRVYTSLTNACYTVMLQDISKGGAFIKSPHLPSMGDIITYVVLDEDRKERFVGNAKVTRVISEGEKHERGFGIELEKNLLDEIIDDLKK
jgi:hypothetical protein